MDFKDDLSEKAVKRKKAKKKKLFTLAAMEQLVAQTNFLQKEYDKLSVDAEERLGYHYNETIHNILFNRHVKTNQELMDKYLTIKRDVDRTKNSGSGKAELDHPALQGLEPEPEGEEPIDSEEPVLPMIDEPVVPVGDEPVDTRVTTESMETGTAGNYSYETPFFLFKGSMKGWMEKWNKKVKSKNLGTTIVKTKTKMENNLMNEGIFSDPDMIDNMFFEYFGVEESKPTIAEEAKPAALQHVERIHKETEKDTAKHLKDVKNGYETSAASGEGADKDSLKHEDVPMLHPSEEQEEYDKLSRGLNMMDRVQDVENLDSETEKRWEDEAGDEAVEDAEDKAKIIKKDNPGAIQPAKVQVVKEGYSLNASYMDDLNKKHIVTFTNTEVKESEIVKENFIKLEMRGLGNVLNESAKSLIESNNFYLDLHTDEIYSVPVNKTLNESVTVKSSEINKFKHLMGYNPRKYERGK